MSDVVTGKSLGLTTVQERLLSVNEVAKVLSVSQRTVHDMAQKGDIPVHRIRGSIRFNPADVDDYIFFSKNTPSLMNIRPSDKEALIKRFDERNEEAKAYLESFFKRRKKTRKEVNA